MTLKNLINKEMTFLELDNYMVELGYNSEELDYYSRIGEINLDEIAENGIIIYTDREDTEQHTEVHFDVIYKHSENEVATATYIRIKQVLPR